MKIEKKIIALSICVFVTGMAITMPMTLLMSAKAQTYDETWFDIEIPYVYFEAGPGIDTDAGYLLERIGIQAAVNQNAVDRELENRIEYFEVTIYADNTQISKINYYISMANAIDKDPSGLFFLTAGNRFAISAVDSNAYRYGGFSIGNTTRSYASILSGMHVIENNGEILTGAQGINSGWIGGDGTEMWDSDNKYRDFIATIDNVQTIQFEVRRTGHITIDGDNTIVTLANDKVIQHIELTKSGNGFTFGTTESLGMSSSKLLTYPYVPHVDSQP